jgi:hypothetical protein
MPAEYDTFPPGPERRTDAVTGPEMTAAPATEETPAATMADRVTRDDERMEAPIQGFGGEGTRCMPVAGAGSRRDERDRRQSRTDTRPGHLAA